MIMAMEASGILYSVKNLFSILISLTIWILIIILLRKTLIPKLKAKREKIRNGEGKKFNPLFYILCGLGFVIDFVIIGFIYQWDFSTGEAIGIMALMIIPGILTQFLYFLPYVIAHYKLHQQQTAIFVLNLFAGWTVIAWIICLVWAFITKKEKIINTVSSNAKQIEEYKDLLDKGILTQEKFDEKKKQLLQ
ncbi:MAG: superinfection immunity protein [Clostridia bacterium]|nr:superinfection immunity protein [Clostridia bacterium]